MADLAALTQLSFPEIDPEFGLAPTQAQVQPTAIYHFQEAEKPLTLPLTVQGEVVLDFGRLVAGRLWIEADGPCDYIWATDPDQLHHILSLGDDRSIYYDIHNVYIHSSPWGHIRGGSRPELTSKHLATFRLLYIKAEQPVTIKRCWVDFSAPHRALSGSFHCNDPELEQLWHVGAYTVLLCAQQNTDSLDGVPAPGNGYVIWDGIQRDKEVWAGDLRPESLAWLAAYGDPEPIRNSLMMLWQARHLGCEQSGLIPGSGSSHQIFHEWTFWFLVNCWEYYMWTGDEAFLETLMFVGGLEQTLQWVERNVNADGLMEAHNTWMYTFKVQGELTALAVTQVAGMSAMASLFEVDGRPELADRARALAQRAAEVIPEKFFDAEAGALLMQKAANGRAHYPLDANAWAILHDVGDEAMRRQCLAALDAPGFVVEAGLRNQWPAFDSSDGEWSVNPATEWMHNETVWPFINCYAAWAKMHAGNITEGFDILRRVLRAHTRQGHTTLWEVMMPDGSNPIRHHGNLGSLCHGWSALGNHLLHLYILGVRLTSPGWRTIEWQPNLGELEWASGIVPTIKGPIELEVRKTPGGLDGWIRLPEGVRLTSKPEGCRIIS